MIKKIVLLGVFSFALVSGVTAQKCKTCDTKNQKVVSVDNYKDIPQKEVLQYAEKNALQIVQMSNEKKHSFEKEVDFSEGMTYLDFVEALPKENGRYFKIKGQNKMILIRSEYSLRIEMAKRKNK